MESKNISHVLVFILVLTVSYFGSGVKFTDSGLFLFSSHADNQDKGVLYIQIKQDLKNSISEYKKNPASWMESSFSAENIFQQVYDFESIKASNALCRNLTQLSKKDLRIFKGEIVKTNLHQNIPCLRSIAKKVALR